MKTYKCNDCGHVFQGGLGISQCPNCGSNNIGINKGKKVPSWIWKVLIPIVVIIAIILVCLKCSNEDGIAKLRVENDCLKIEVSGINNSTLKRKYCVQVYSGKGLVSTIEFKDSHAQYNKDDMVPGESYTFKIVYKKNKKLADKIKNNPLTWEYAEEDLPKPPIIGEVKQDIDRDNVLYVITIVIADTSNAEEFAIKEGEHNTDDVDVSSLEWQTDTLFKIKGDKDRMITCFAKNEQGVDSQQVFLKKIRPLPKPITKGEVQNILDRVSSGSMTVSTALAKLADGNCNLKHAIDEGNIKTLYGVLTECTWGRRFTVVSFSLDSETNLIKSGTLEVRAK